MTELERAHLIACAIAGRRHTRPPTRTETAARLGLTVPRPPRLYGPHDPTAAPADVVVLEARKWPAELVAAIPRALVAQRRALNELAARRGRVAS